MRLKTWIYFISLFCANASLAQTLLPPVYEIKTDTAVARLPDTYWQMLVDTSGRWTINDVQSPLISTLFHTNSTRETGIGYSGLHYYWLRIRLKNSTGKEAKLIFFNLPLVDRYDLFVFHPNGKSDHLVSGGYIPMSKRDGFKDSYCVPVVLAPQEEVIIYKKIFIKMIGGGDELFVGFTFYQLFIEQNYLHEPWYVGDVRNWLIAGILFFGFFFNFFFYWIDKDKVYLYMALLLLVEGLWYLISNRTITFREDPNFKSYFSIIITHCFFFLTVTQFVRHFLKTRKYYPKWDRVLILLISLVITTAVVRFFFLSDIITKPYQPISELIVSIVFAVNMICLLFSFLLLRRKRDMLNNLSVVAAVPLFFLWGVGYTTRDITWFFSTTYHNTIPGFLEWYFKQQLVIEMFCVGWFAILFTWILLQRYALLRKLYTQQELIREKEKTELMNRQNEILEQKVEDRTAELKKSLEELQNTQSQLIQAEKMASLGELTAGIAHEIQNPLNFVNNFSELNSELIAEMKQQIDKQNLEEVKLIAGNIDENEQKIILHGKRADAIVKGMLQHSRSSSGIKELIDINALADEYIRLAYHGLRARDKSFNAIIKTDFDDKAATINIIPQDIGRVILNLITNAFYAVAEKKKQQPSDYEPTVFVSTKKNENGIEVRVRDNGNGIPNKVLDKIFQPFFTTKPSGQGTGLGLSMSYDIIKAHGGELKVDTEVGVFTEFLLWLPK